MERFASLISMVALLVGCPSFPDPVKPEQGDLGQNIDSSQPDLPQLDLPVQPDAEPVLPDAPYVPDATTKNLLGEVCGVNAHCKSGFCADYTCCDSACQGTCRACNLPGKVGTCSAVPDGDDPRHDCNGAPKDTCGDDGQCDGKGACRKWAAGTLCGTAQCSSYSNKLTNVKACDGAGSCSWAPDIKCDPFSCSTSTDQCYTSCTDNNEGYTCQGWYGCDASKNTCYTTCSSKYHCQSGGKCSSGKCVDGD